MISRALTLAPTYAVRCFRRHLTTTTTTGPTKTEDDCPLVEKPACTEEESLKQEEEVECENNLVPTDDGNIIISQRIRPEFPGKVRLGFIPEEWFQFFYPKTGVTGPYMFGAGLITYLVSKEIYVLEHEYYTGLSLAILLIWAVKALGPRTAMYADKEIDKIEAEWESMHQADLEYIKKSIELEKEEQWRAEGALMLIEAKREMIDMQLEAAYREEVMKVYEDIISRLDYQVACANLEKRIGQKHMMYWIHDQVLKAINADGNIENFEKIKGDLSAMAIRVKDYEAAEETKNLSLSEKLNKST